MKVGGIWFVTPVVVPGRLGRHPEAIASEHLALSVEDGFVRMTADALTVLVPMSNVAYFVAIETPAPKKRGAK